MYFPKNLSKADLIMGLTAAAAVLLSGMAMNRLSMGTGQAASGAAWAQAEVVSQAAIAPEARADMPAIAANACPISLDLLDEGNGMVGGTLLAPCLPSSDLVLAHAGMVFSARTLASGALFFSLPALKSPASVDVRFTSGETASGTVEIPEATQIQRVAVQWPHVDGFAIHAFENGAAFGDKGHIWAENRNTPEPGAAPKGGYLTRLGDATVAMPLLAEVYTYPARGAADLVLEAAVTENTCAGEAIGDVIAAKAGDVQTSEVSLAMPDCDAVGEFVQMALPQTAVDLAMVN